MLAIKIYCQFWITTTKSTMRIRLILRYKLQQNIYDHIYHFVHNLLLTVTMKDYISGSLFSWDFIKYMLCFSKQHKLPCKVINNTFFTIFKKINQNKYM